MAATSETDRERQMREAEDLLGAEKTRSFAKGAVFRTLCRGPGLPVSGAFAGGAGRAGRLRGTGAPVPGHGGGPRGDRS